MPFSTDPESFGQRILTRPNFRYMTAAEFDQVTGNPNPLSNIIGPDTEVLYIEAPDLKRPENTPKRTFITGDTSPVGKWARWVNSWRDNGREFDGADPSKHDGEFMWLALKEVSMGKRGRHEVWMYDGVPSPEEIAALGEAAQQPTVPSGPPANWVPKAEEAEAPPPAPAVNPQTIKDAIEMAAADGIGALALFAAVNEMVLVNVPRNDVQAARDELLAAGVLRQEGDRLITVPSTQPV